MLPPGRLPVLARPQVLHREPSITDEYDKIHDGMFRLLNRDENGRVAETDSRLGQSAPGYVPLDLAKV